VRVSVRAPLLPAAATSRSAYAFVLIISLFFLWGVANNLNDILIKQFKEGVRAFRLPSRAGPECVFMPAISCCAAGESHHASLGLQGGAPYWARSVCDRGLSFLPRRRSSTYAVFLGALFIIASGLAFLETAANPLVTVLGPAEGAARRLNLAQSFNPLGSITGVLIGPALHFLWSRAHVPHNWPG